MSVNGGCGPRLPVGLGGHPTNPQSFSRERWAVALGGSSKGPEIRERTEMCSARLHARTHGKQIKVGYKKKII